MAAVHKASPVGADGVVRCYKHGLQAALRKSHTLTNPERQFYCCPKHSSADGCGFICWADDLPASPSASQPAIGSSQQGQPTRHADTDLPTTPRKRPFDSTSSLTPRLASSQKRTRIMEEALAEQSTPTRSDPRARAVHSNSKGEEEGDDDDALWFPTPPSTLQKPNTRPGEGSQNHGPGTHASGSTLPTDAGDPFVLRSLPDSQATISSSTTNDEGHGEGTELSSYSISTLLSALDGIPDYVRKLERKTLAAEKSSQAKAHRITELEAEVERLKQRNKALETTIDVLAPGRLGA